MEKSIILFKNPCKEIFKNIFHKYLKINQLYFQKKNRSFYNKFGKKSLQNYYGYKKGSIFFLVGSILCITGLNILCCCLSECSDLHIVTF